MGYTRYTLLHNKRQQISIFYSVYKVFGKVTLLSLYGLQTTNPRALCEFRSLKPVTYVFVFYRRPTTIQTFC